MNTIIWKGIPSEKIEGLLICELPPISKPPLRVKETTVDGRDGSIIEELGYSSYDKTITIGLRGNYDINKVIKYFTGEGEIIFSNEPDKVYTAKVIDHIDYNRLMRFRTAVVTFRVQPFKHKYNEAYKEAQTATAEGASVVVTGGANVNLKAFSIYGKTTQDGTPTPDAPVDLVSLCADGTISVAVNDTEVVFAVADGLRGIPVSSGGNYTDASGQQWICDEIDLARGVYIQRVGVLTTENFAGTVFALNNGTNSANYNQYTAYGAFSGTTYPLGSVSTDSNIKALCNIFPLGTQIQHNVAQEAFWIYSRESVVFILNKSNHPDAESAKEYILNSGLVLCYPLATPIETPLSEEELAAYASLYTYQDNTIVSNDASAHMKVEYFKPFEVFNEGLEDSKPIMVLRGRGTVGISVNGVHIFDYTFPDGETEVVIDSEKEDAYLGEVLKNRNMNGEFPTLLAGTNKIEWSGYVESIEILPRSRWL